MICCSSSSPCVTSCPNRRAVEWKPSACSGTHPAPDALPRHLCAAGGSDAGTALGLKVRTNAPSTSPAEAVLLGFERSQSPALMELEAQDFRPANACLRAWRLSCSAPGEASAVIRHHADGCVLAVAPQLWAAPGPLRSSRLLLSSRLLPRPGSPPRAQTPSNTTRASVPPATRSGRRRRSRVTSEPPWSTARASR